jgi:DNA-binding PadR family transcriptional regulator
MARRVETPVSSHVAVLQELRWGEASARVLISSIAERTGGYVRIHTSLVYKALYYLLDQGLVRQLAGSSRQAGATFKLTAKGAQLAARQADALRALFEHP